MRRKLDAYIGLFMIDFKTLVQLNLRAFKIPTEYLPYTTLCFEHNGTIKMSKTEHREPFI